MMGSKHFSLNRHKLGCQSRINCCAPLSPVLCRKKAQEGWQLFAFLGLIRGSVRTESQSILSSNSSIESFSMDLQIDFMLDSLLS